MIKQVIKYFKRLWEKAEPDDWHELNIFAQCIFIIFPIIIFVPVVIVDVFNTICQNLFIKKEYRD